MEKLGIIGGMGPLATAYLFNRIVEFTDAQKDQDHIDIVILNHATLPDRTEVIKSGKYENFISAIVKDGKELEKLGVSNIAIPCNTSHFFYDEIQKRLDVNVINMVKETVLYIKNNKTDIKKVGIMATDGTIKTKTYAKECILQGIEPVLPSEKMQKTVMSIIYDEIKNGKKGSLDRFMEVVDELREKECDMVILACTELSYFKEYHNIPEYCIDAMDVLVKKSIELSGKKCKMVI